MSPRPATTLRAQGKSVYLVSDLDESMIRLRSFPDWSAAACRNSSRILTGLFFSTENADIAMAKAICFGCPLKHDCLEAAVVRREPCGVWGGELIANGRIIAHKRPRGRPRKAESAPHALAVL